jgi:aerobic carbon-monoxide dehydrogenase medium subunit
VRIATVAAVPDVHLPASAEEAVALFADGAGVTVFAGGTILMPELTAGLIDPGKTLLLGRAGLDTITVDGSTTRIGAAVPVAELVESPARILAAAAANVGDAEIRAQGTVGGNVCAPPGREVPRGDLQAPLIALGAQVRSTGAGGERIEPIEEFLAGGDRAARLVLELSFEDAERPQGYAAIGRPHAHTYTILSAAVARDGDGLRVAVGGAGPTAIRCGAVEASGDPEDAAKDVRPVDDALASAWYRSKMLPVVIRRALAELENG